MKRIDLNSMSTDELLAIHDQLAAMLSAKLIARKKVLEERLRQLTPLIQAERPRDSAH
jgi:DNA-binding protein H-NS